MKTTLVDVSKVSYQMWADDESPIVLDRLLGHKLKICHSGRIFCSHCSKKTPKSYSGHCYNCFTKLAAADLCSVKPETCHFHRRTCRQPDWGAKHCYQSHTIYLANSSGLKVGITRTVSELQRWMDQGASQATPLGYVRNRLEAGLVEQAIAKQVSDKTQWKKMLSGPPAPMDLAAERHRLLASVPDHVGFEPAHGAVQHFDYPVLQYPTSITRLDLDKTPALEGTLLGIKGQYLILDCGVINIRKHMGYEVRIELEDRPTIAPEAVPAAHASQHSLFGD